MVSQLKTNLTDSKNTENYKGFSPYKEYILITPDDLNISFKNKEDIIAFFELLQKIVCLK